MLEEKRTEISSSIGTIAPIEEKADGKRAKNFTVRDAPDHHMLIIAPPFKIEDTGDRDQDILITTAKLTKLIESYIRQYPAQWWWFHRRWKKVRRCNEQPLSAADCTIQPCIH